MWPNSPENLWSQLSTAQNLPCGKSLRESLTSGFHSQLPQVTDFFLQIKCYRTAKHMKHSKANLLRPKWGIGGWNLCPGFRQHHPETPEPLQPDCGTLWKRRHGAVILITSPGRPETWFILYYSESPGSWHIAGPQ